VNYILAVALMMPSLHAQTKAPRPHVLGLAHVAFRASDLDRTELFYESLLGYEEPFALNDSNGKPTIAFVKITVALVLISTPYAQQAKSLDGKLPDIVHRMENGDLATREAAFDELMDYMGADKTTHVAGTPDLVNKFIVGHPEDADRVKLGLVHLLIRENYLFVEDRNPPAGYDEGDSEHYAQLVEVVSSLDDERTIPALVGAMTTGGMAERGVLKYGDRALEPVLEQLKNPNELVRATALSMSITLLEARSDMASRMRIRELIRSSLMDPASVVRGHAVKEIDCLSDRQNFVPILEKLAKADPENYPGKEDDDGVDGDKFFPVRVDARRVLRDIQNNKDCAP
jgi:hypothetical protein